jgi:hypothetical protein
MITYCCLLRQTLKENHATLIICQNLFLHFIRIHSEALSMHNGRAGLFVVLLRYPHVFKRRV